MTCVFNDTTALLRPLCSWCFCTLVETRFLCTLVGIWIIQMTCVFLYPGWILHFLMIIFLLWMKLVCIGLLCRWLHSLWGLYKCRITCSIYLQKMNFYENLYTTFHQLKKLCTVYFFIQTLDILSLPWSGDDLKKYHWVYDPISFSVALYLSFFIFLFVTSRACALMVAAVIHFQVC